MASCRLLPAMPAEQGGRPSRDDSTSSKDAEPGRGDRSKIFRVTVIVIKWCQVGGKEGIVQYSNLEDNSETTEAPQSARPCR